MAKESSGEESSDEIRDRRINKKKVGTNSRE